MLQCVVVCVAVCCSVLQCMLQFLVQCVLQCVVAVKHCSVLQCVAVCGAVCGAVCAAVCRCNVSLQCVALKSALHEMMSYNTLYRLFYRALLQKRPVNSYHLDMKDQNIFIGH